MSRPTGIITPDFFSCFAFYLMKIVLWIKLWITMPVVAVVFNNFVCFWNQDVCNKLRRKRPVEVFACDKTTDKLLFTTVFGITTAFCADHLSSLG